MPTDRYGNSLTTASAAAREAYVRAVDLLLSGTVGAEAAFARAIDADDGFALAHVGLARTLQLQGRGGDAKAPIARARELAPHATARERSHIDIFAKILDGHSAAALQAVRAHVADWPRDAMALAPATSVFGLIGFSGLAGREEGQYALLASLAPAYGDDWWFLAQLAFSEAETARHVEAVGHIEAAIARAPRNAHGAHIRAHVYYELGERSSGLRYLTEWAKDYPREGQLHCHLCWHLALWSLELGQNTDAWRIYRDNLHPGASWGPQLNVLTDSAAFLQRAAIAGEAVAPELWADLSAYAVTWFPNPGIAFADVHAALAHATTGNGEALERIRQGAKGPAGDIVGALAEAFDCYSRGAWSATIDALQPLLADHERIGGSRAQRDLVEYTLADALIRAGRPQEARSLLSSRRPQNGREVGFPLAGLG